MKLTALIPAYNDAYTLGLCLGSIVEHFQEVLVLDDASTDETPEVAYAFSRWYPHVRYFRHQGPQLGWVEIRNRLLTLTDARHLFWLDSDDVLCQYNAGMLKEIAGGKRPLVRLRLCEMWGDLFHTTQRLAHYDRCHLYVDRERFRDFAWSGGAGARPSAPDMISAAYSGGPLLFHLKGVKPDRRLLERHHVRGFLRASERPDALGEFRGIDALSDEEVHERALDIVLRSRQDHLVPTYLRPDLIPNAVRRPEVIEAALPGRFRIVYKAGQPIDRTDAEAKREADPGRERSANTRPHGCRGSHDEGTGPVAGAARQS